MLAAVQPPALPAPSSGASAGATADAAAAGGPDHFARLLDAADARRSAAQPTAKQPPKDGPAGPGADDEGAPDTPAGSDATVADPAALLASLAGLSGLGLTVPPVAAGAAAGGGDAPAQRPGAAHDGRTAAKAAPLAAARGAGSAPPGPLTATPGAASAAFDALMEAANAHGAVAAHAGPDAPPAAALAATIGDKRVLATETMPDTAVLPSALPAASGPGAAGTAGATAATSAQARLGAAPGSAEFARQLGTQLTTFVRDGVQHARLELHPLELGPVTVQIQLDGDKAQVRLAAEHANTRQALEQALPTLAGSLREAGITLSGGGVSDQPRQPQPEAQPATPGGRSADAGSLADSAPAAAAGAPRRRGVVDLIA